MVYRMYVYSRRSNKVGGGGGWGDKGHVSWREWVSEESCFSDGVRPWGAPLRTPTARNASSISCSQSGEFLLRLPVSAIEKIAAPYNRTPRVLGDDAYDYYGTGGTFQV